MLISSHYFIYNAHRDTEKNWYCNTDDTGACSSSEVQEKRKEIDEKNNFQQRYVNVTKRGNSSRTMI